MFKKKSPIEKLEARYNQLMKESFELSKVNRKKADLKYAEAESLMLEIEQLRAEPK